MQHTEQVQGVLSGVGDSANKLEVSGKAACNARGDRVRAMLRVRFGDDIYSSWFASLEFESFDGVKGIHRLAELTDPEAVKLCIEATGVKDQEASKQEMSATVAA